MFDIVFVLHHLSKSQYNAVQCPTEF